MGYRRRWHELGEAERTTRILIATSIAILAIWLILTA